MELHPCSHRFIKTASRFAPSNVKTGKADSPPHPTTARPLESQAGECNDGRPPCRLSQPVYAVGSEAVRRRHGSSTAARGKGSASAARGCGTWLQHVAAARGCGTWLRHVAAARLRHAAACDSDAACAGPGLAGPRSIDLPASGTPPLPPRDDPHPRRRRA